METGGGEHPSVLFSPSLLFLVSRVQCRFLEDLSQAEPVARGSPLDVEKQYQSAGLWPFTYAQLNTPPNFSPPVYFFGFLVSNSGSSRTSLTPSPPPAAARLMSSSCTSKRD